MIFTKEIIIKILTLFLMLSVWGFVSTKTNTVENILQGKQKKKHVKKEKVATVLLKNIAFVPKIIKVKPGTKIKWINKDTAMHTVISGTPKKTTELFESKNLGLGGTFEYTFKKKGIYRYYCGTHPTQMKAIVIVK